MTSEARGRPPGHLGPLRVSDSLLTESRAARRCTIGECQAWCCIGGVSVDLGEKEDILRHADWVKPYLPADRRDERGWFDGQDVADPEYPSGHVEGTTVVDDPTHPAGYTCIFLRPEDRRCALQLAGAAAGLGRWGLKPFYCGLYPLTIENGVLCMDDENELYLEGGNCHRESSQVVPLHQLFHDEIVLAVGEERLQQLISGA